MVPFDKLRAGLAHHQDLTPDELNSSRCGIGAFNQTLMDLQETMGLSWGMSAASAIFVTGSPYIEATCAKPPGPRVLCAKFAPRSDFIWPPGVT